MYSKAFVILCRKKNLLNKNQFGFRTGLSTQDALAAFVKELKMSDGKPRISIFLDLAKAFDTLDHILLFKKLYRMGIRGKVLDILRSYLTDRTQRVRINKGFSEPRTVVYGVPQGTVLGPLLFILYINDLFSMSNGQSILIFADDTAITYQDSNWDTLILEVREHLKRILLWFEKNSLTVNYDKTFFMAFGNKLELKEIKINDLIIIKRVQKIKYLGVIFDDKMKMNFYVENVISRVRYLPYVF